MKAAPEQFRIKLPSIYAAAKGNNGAFKIPHYKIVGYYFTVVISDGMGWEHVSVTIDAKHRKVDRCPTWEEMCFIKDVFFQEEECVMQLHPPKSEYVSNHPYCLHLWKPTFAEIPRPDSIQVGVKSVNIQS